MKIEAKINDIDVKIPVEAIAVTGRLDPFDQEVVWVRISGKWINVSDGETPYEPPGGWVAELEGSDYSATQIWVGAWADYPHVADYMMHAMRAYRAMLDFAIDHIVLDNGERISDDSDTDWNELPRESVEFTVNEDDEDEQLEEICETIEKCIGPEAARLQRVEWGLI